MQKEGRGSQGDALPLLPLNSMGAVMGSVSPLYRKEQFEPEETHAMGVAFEFAWQILEANAPKQNIPETRTALARTIFELAQRGESDPVKLSAHAVAMMRL